MNGAADHSSEGLPDRLRGGLGDGATLADEVLGSYERAGLHLPPTVPLTPVPLEAGRRPRGGARRHRAR